MKSAKKILTLFFFSLAVAFTGCPEPVGGLLYSVDYIKAVPNKATYGRDEWFKPEEHLTVIGVISGKEEIIPINDVDIKIIQDPDFTDDDKVIPVPNKHIGVQLEHTGLKAVIINYNNLEASYVIIVGEPGEVVGGWGSDGESGTGVVIIWLD